MPRGVPGGVRPVPGAGETVRGARKTPAHPAAYGDFAHIATNSASEFIASAMIILLISYARPGGLRFICGTFTVPLSN